MNRDHEAMNHALGVISSDVAVITPDVSFGCLTSGAILPAFRVARPVGNRDDDDQIVLRDEEHLVWKSACQSAACVPMQQRMVTRIAPDRN